MQKKQSLQLKLYERSGILVLNSHVEFVFMQITLYLVNYHHINIISILKDFPNKTISYCVAFFMRNHYNFNFLWECNICCHVTVLEPNSAAALPLETVPLAWLEMAKKGFCTWTNITLVRRKG